MQNHRSANLRNQLISSHYQCAFAVAREAKYNFNGSQDKWISENVFDAAHRAAHEGHEDRDWVL
jgi:hypothetical protein